MKAPAVEEAVEKAPIPASIGLGQVTRKETQTAEEEPSMEEALPPVPDKPYEEMTIQELQAAILEKMAKNGPVTDQMKKQVTDNIWPDSLRNWVKSFR